MRLGLLAPQGALGIEGLIVEVEALVGQGRYPLSAGSSSGDR